MTSNIDRRVYERDIKKSFVYITVIRQLIRCIVSGDYRTMDMFNFIGCMKYHSVVLLGRWRRLLDKLQNRQ